MATAVLDMSMSLDGFIAGPDDSPELPGGAGFSLHDWIGDPDDPSTAAGRDRDLMEAVRAAGAILSGRRTAEQAGHWGGDHHGMGVPIFVISRRAPSAEVAAHPLVHYVDDVADAVRQAKEAAGDRRVHMIGAAWVPAALEAGAIDEIQIHHVPLLLGAGRRLFELLPAPIRLEIAEVISTPRATHVRYRVLY
ncbi:dihydrofolate reductase family protein [Agrococcus sp. DT81.2]|uniref:dihydrofolate reductase family protein n=1 Tax=Agrococcus sp. DT81.2 TaxID=3393414 RepID=UPI003CE47B5C